MKILLVDIQRLATIRPEGYYEDVLSRGVVEGAWLSIPDPALVDLRLKYAPRGLGDRVARIAKPIAGAIDSVLGTNLANCQGCHGPGGRQEWLNEVFPENKAKGTDIGGVA